MPTTDSKPIELRMKAELRRAAGWGLGGMVVVTIVAALVGPDIGQTIGYRAMSLGLTVNYVFVECWRLRVEETGIARRRSCWWSSWTWEQFRGGQVCRGNSPLEFRCSSRPWWDRRLLLGTLDVDAARTLNQHLLAMLPREKIAAATAMQAGTTPADSTVNFALELAGSGRVTLSHNAIEASIEKRDRLYLWGEVREVRLERFAFDRDFHYRMVVTFVSGEVVAGSVKSVCRDARRIWSIHSATSAWPQQLSLVVPAEKWRFLRTTGELQSAEEATFRLVYWERKERLFYRLPIFAVPLFEILTAIAFIPKLANVWQAQFLPWWWKPITLTILGLVVIMPGVLLGAICWMVRQRSQAAQQETREELARLSDASQRETATTSNLDSTREDNEGIEGIDCHRG